MTRLGVIALCASLLEARVSSAQELPRVAGEPLTTALKLLQDRGLRLVYSSAIVTPQLRVLRQPRRDRNLEILEELLEPHDLVATHGPGGVLQIVRRPARPVRQHTGSSRSRAQVAAAGPTATAGTYDEAIVVSAQESSVRAIDGETVLHRWQLSRAPGAVAGDPARAFRQVAGVLPIDDFSSEFIVRGSAPRHTAVLIDDVPTGWMRHAIYGGADSGSLLMIGADAIDRAVLHIGGGPLRDVDRLGAQLDLTLREGQRDRTSMRATLSSTAATVAAEGPIAAAQGSWVVTARHSLFDWPTRSLARELPGTSFGYHDVQAKLAYDVRPGHHLTFSAVAGHSNGDEGDERRVPALAAGTHDATLMNLGWRAEAGSRMTIVQRVYFGTHQFENVGHSGDVWTHERSADGGYIAHVTWVAPQMVLQSGGHVQRRQHSASGTKETRQAAYAHVRIPLGQRVTLAPGVRVTHASDRGAAPASRWIQGVWQASPRIALSVSAGLLHQFVSAHDARVMADVIERARYGEAAAVLSFGSAFQAKAAAFARHESLAGQLNGVSRGVEISINHNLLEHVVASASYSYARTLYTSVATGELFPGDYDQKHAIHAGASYQRSGFDLQTAFRYTSNLPLAGYVTMRDDRLFVGTERNTVRLRPYARVDVRVARSFTLGWQRAEVFGEVLNVFGRQNLGPATGTIDAATGRAYGFTEALLPRLPSIGVTLKWNQR